MSLVSFTVEYDLLAAGPDDSDSGAELDILPLIGEIDFTAQLDTRALQAVEYLPRPAGFKILKFTGTIDTDGRLKSARSGTVGVRLPANDPVLQLAEPLVYKVEFRLTTPIGERVHIAPGYFLAPATDSTVQLAEVLEGSISSAAAAPRLSGGAFGTGTVTFENEDGSTLSPISIPGGVVVFTDNGDSTWSVG